MRAARRQGVRIQHYIQLFFRFQCLSSAIPAQIRAIPKAKHQKSGGIISASIMIEPRVRSKTPSFLPPLKHILLI